jgi:hypothetical protein
LLFWFDAGELERIGIDVPEFKHSPTIEGAAILAANAMREERAFQERASWVVLVFLLLTRRNAAWWFIWMWWRWRH